MRMLFLSVLFLKILKILKNSLKTKHINFNNKVYIKLNVMKANRKCPTDFSIYTFK